MHHEGIVTFDKKARANNVGFPKVFGFRTHPYHLPQDLEQMWVSI